MPNKRHSKRTYKWAKRKVRQFIGKLAMTFGRPEIIRYANQYDGEIVDSVYTFNNVSLHVSVGITYDFKRIHNPNPRKHPMRYIFRSDAKVWYPEGEVNIHIKGFVDDTIECGLCAFHEDAAQIACGMTDDPWESNFDLIGYYLDMAKKMGGVL